MPVKSVQMLLQFSVMLISAMFLTYLSGLRGLTGTDTVTYLDFYQSVLTNGIGGRNGCQSFEPVFCVLSFIAVNAFHSPLVTQYFWVFLYFIITFKAFSIFYGLMGPKNNHTFVSTLFFIFICINYVDPQIIFF